MRNICLILTLLIILTAGPAGSFAQGTFTRFTDIPYVPGAGVSQTLDLYIPDGMTERTPLIIWIHGGGWLGGDKALNQNGHQLRYARRGYAVASINYRLSGEAIFPAQIHDSKAAIRWLRANASTYNLDPARFGVWGSSAGGHLAALVGTSAENADLEGNIGGNTNRSSRVQAVADWYGPTNFLLMDTQLKSQPGCGSGNHDDADSAESRLVGCPIQSCPAAVQRANPMTYLTADDPPFFIQHGTADCTVPTGQSQIFFDLLTGAGHDASYVPIVSAGHGGPLFVTETNLVLMDQFWETKLRQRASPLIESVTIRRKGITADSFMPGSLAALYRVNLIGPNIGPDSKVLINGVERGASTVPGGLEVVGFPGRLPPSGTVTVQIVGASGTYSNLISIPISAG